MQRKPKNYLLMINRKDFRTAAGQRKIGNRAQKQSDHRGLERPTAPGPGKLVELTAARLGGYEHPRGVLHYKGISRY
jgi:hypothetical protein